MKISLSILWDFLFVQALVDLREYSQCQFYCKWKQIKTIEVKLNKVITCKTPNNNQTGTSIKTTVTKYFFTDTEISHSFPSQYSHPQIIVLAIVITLMMVVVVVGNMLVIIAIATEHSLNLVQNWFIASLAFADLSLGLIIMPFSLAYEVSQKSQSLNREIILSYVSKILKMILKGKKFWMNHH